MQVSSSCLVHNTAGAQFLLMVSASADGKSSGSKRKGGRQSRSAAEKAAKRRRMVGGVLKTVGTAAPGQQCTQCGTQVLPIPSCLLLQPLAAQSLLPFHTLHDVARRVWPLADSLLQKCVVGSIHAFQASLASQKAGISNNDQEHCDVWR